MRGVNVRTSGDIHRSLFGDVVLVAFLLAQAFDGVLTYVGVSTYGVRMEGNPLLGWLMATVGQGVALTAAKTTAAQSRRTRSEASRFAFGVGAVILSSLLSYKW